jgi:hypothetical protein
LVGKRPGSTGDGVCESSPEVTGKPRCLRQRATDHAVPPGRRDVLELLQGLLEPFMPHGIAAAREHQPLDNERHRRTSMLGAAASLRTDHSLVPAAAV